VFEDVLVAWSSCTVSACGDMGREIESRQGIGWQILSKKANTFKKSNFEIKKRDNS
jgi:hypothetical protein